MTWIKLLMQTRIIVIILGVTLILFVPPCLSETSRYGESHQETRITSDGEVCTEETQGLTRLSVCASSILRPQSGNTYVSGNLFDSRKNTAWVEGGKGDGLGDYIFIQFQKPQTVHHVDFINGYAKNNAIFTKNSRIKRLKIIASNGKSLTTTLLDAQEWQTIALNDYESLEWIQFIIGSVYHGTKYEDTALSELRLR